MRPSHTGHSRVHLILLAAGLLIAAPFVGPDTGRASAQSRPTFRHAPAASAQLSEVRSGAGLRLETPRRKKTQTRVIIGTVVGATAGWLIGRSQGDNFGAHGIILLAGFGALMGLAFTPRP